MDIGGSSFGVSINPRTNATPYNAIPSDTQRLDIVLEYLKVFRFVGDHDMLHVLSVARARTVICSLIKVIFIVQ